MSRTLALALVPLTLLAASLTGCTNETRLPPPEPAAEGEPLFASDDEALAAATAAYEEYLAVVDAALGDPTRPADFNRVAAREQIMELEQSRSQFVEEGYRIEGQRQLGGAVLQQWFPTGSATTVVSYMCEDLSQVTLIDAQGNSLSTADRPNFSVFETTIEFEDAGFVVVDRSFWQNTESC